MFIIDYVYESVIILVRHVNDGKLWMWKHFQHHPIHEPREENVVLDDTSVDREGVEVTLISDASVHVGNRQVAGF